MELWGITPHKRRGRFYTIGVMVHGAGRGAGEGGRGTTGLDCQGSMEKMTPETNPEDGTPHKAQNTGKEGM